MRSWRRLASVLVAFLVSGPLASAQPLPGMGCNTIVPGGPAPQTYFVFPPALGSQFHLRESELVPSTPTWLILGTAPAAVPLPFASCVLFVSPAGPLFILPAGLSSASGVAKQTFSLPTDPALLGGTVYFQAFQFTGPTTWAFTNGVAATIETPCGFTGATYAARPVVVPIGPSGGSTVVTLTGSFSVTPAGDATGSVTASFSGGSAVISLSPSTMTISTAGTTLDLCVNACSDSTVLVNGVPTPIGMLVDTFGSDVAAFGTSLGSWSPLSLCTLAEIALMSTSEMVQNTCAAQGDGLDASWWCKTVVYAVTCIALGALCAAPCVGALAVGPLGTVACTKWVFFCITIASLAGAGIYIVVTEQFWS